MMFISACLSVSLPPSPHHPSLPIPTYACIQAFHGNKRLREVDAMLLRLYNPIIWRCVF